MRPDVHNCKRRLEQVLQNIEKDEAISEKNKKAMFDFHNYAIAQGLTLSRVLRYLYDVRNLAHYLKKDFDQTTREDIEKVLTELEKSDYAEYTKHGFRIVIRKFYKWLRGTEDLPPEVKWYKIKQPKDRVKLPETLLTEKDIASLIDAANNPRDKAFVAVLYEGGFRIGEMLSIQLKHIRFDEYGAQLLVDGKTGARRVRIISSVPYLTAWLNAHPKKNDPEAALWVSYLKKKMVTYHCYSRMLITLKNRAGLMKAVNPHNFRHSRATYLANHLTEAQMKELFGWTKDSDMAAVYVHLSGRDVDRALLRTHGIKMEDTPEEKSLLLPKQCKRCHDTNPATNVCCKVCGLPLDEKIADEIIVNELKRRQADEALDRLLKNDRFKEVLNKFLTDSI
jgi:site-specific recombinase XerD